MHGKLLSAIHYMRPAHVKAGFKYINRLCIDNTGSLFQALTTRIEKNFSLRVVEHLFFSVCSCVLSWYSPPFLQAELRPCTTVRVFIYLDHVPSLSTICKFL